MSIPHSLAPALRAFADGAARQQGARLRHVLLFGSQARGEATPESDVDVAVILDDGPDALFALGDVAYDVLLETGVVLQTVPIRLEHWDHPERHPNPTLIANIRRDAVEILP